MQNQTFYAMPYILAGSMAIQILAHTNTLFSNTLAQIQHYPPSPSRTVRVHFGERTQSVKQEQCNEGCVVAVYDVR